MRFFSKNFTQVKAFAGNDFMKSMESAKKVVQSTQSTTIESFETSFTQAVKILGEFARSQNSATLKQCAKQFLNLIQQKPSRVEPYVYMAYILYLYNKKDEALKYIKLSESIDPDYKFIKEVKNCIYS
jgi:hypothetical protein